MNTPRYENKPVVILGQGPSVSVLEEKIHLFKGDSVYWASLNRFDVLEEGILSKIGSYFTFIWWSTTRRFIEYRGRLKSAASRGTVLMSSGIRSGQFDFPANIHISDYGAGFSSIFSMLCAFLDIGFRDIYLIGFDGRAMSKSEVYYSQDKMNDDFRTRAISIERDTKMMNMFFWPYVGYALNVQKEDVSIINQIGSAIDCFPRMTIEDIAKRVSVR